MADSKWARWFWKDQKALGRFHAVVGPDETPGKVRLACGRVRARPTITRDRPDDPQCCSTCRQLDDLRLNYTKEKVTA